MQQLFRHFFNFFFRAPVFPGNESKTRSALFLHISLLSSIAVLSALFLMRELLMVHTMILPTFILSGLIAAFIVLLILVHYGKVKSASILFAVIGWSGMTIEALFADGIRDIAVLGNIIVILISLLLLGRRTAMLFTILSVSSIWLMYWLETTRNINPRLDTITNYARDLTAIFILIALIIYLYARSQQISMNRIRNELEERQKAEKKLLDSEKKLREQNKEYALLNMKLKSAVRKAKESDQLKTTFLQNISHELRSPMNTIMGFSELLNNPELTEVQRADYTKAITSSSRQLLTVVTNILSISSIQTGQEEVKSSTMNINAMLHELEMTCQLQIQNKDLILKIIPSLPDEKATIMTDEAKLNQVLLNLTDNAIKFTPAGSVEVGYTLDDNKIWFYVKDTGIGIHASLHKKIFDRFNQADDSARVKYGGTGLGLAIAKAQVEMLGGKIKVQSSPGEGSVFSFSLPVKPAVTQSSDR